MNEPATYNYFFTQVDIFSDYFKITKATMEEEAIHQMRVAVKRIRSILKFKKHLGFPNILNESQFEVLKKIFSISGELRDLHIQSNLLKEYSETLKFPFSDFKNYLSEAEKCVSALLAETIKPINAEEFLQIKLTSVLQRELPGNVGIERESAKFIRKKIRKIEKLLLNINNDTYVHNLRKQVKQLFFILQFLKQTFPESIFGNYKLQTLRLAGQTLGDWHDRVVIKVSLNNFCKQKGNNFLADNPKYQTLIFYVEDEKQKILKNLDVELFMETLNLKELLKSM